MNTKMRTVFCTLFLSSFIVLETRAGIVNALSCSKADVQSSLDAASAGDTIIVPPGSCTWSGVVINNPITLQGSGIGQTTITLGSYGALTMTKQVKGVIRLKNFSFIGSGSTRTITIQGSWRNAEPIVVQNNEFTLKGGSLFDISVAGGVVFSKNSFTGREVNEGSFTVKDLVSTDSWSTADSIGNHDTNGKLNIYIEDNTFYGQSNGIIDADDNSRIVIRHNTLSYGGFNSHGMDTSPYGMRHFEIYENNFQHPDYNSQLANVNKLIWVRGGTGVIFNNQIVTTAGSNWGDKPEGQFDIRAQQDGSGVTYGDFKDGRAWLSCGKGAYPRQHQLAVNWSPSVSSNGGYFIDPIYIWGNTGTGTNGNGGVRNFQNGGAWGSQAGYFVSGRDYFNGGTPKPNYTPYTYPHPLVKTSTSTDVLSPPTGVTAKCSNPAECIVIP